MHKQDLVDAVAEKAGLSKADAGRAVDAVGDVITQALTERDDVTLPGVGKFSAQHKEARDVVTFGVEKHIEAKHVPKFKAATALKTAIA